LTDGIIEIVTKHFEKLYGSQSEVIAKHLVAAIFRNQASAEAFIDGLLQTKFGQVATSRMKGMVYDALVTGAKDHFDQIALTVVDHAGPVIAKVIAAASSVPIAKAILIKASYLLAGKLTIIIAKALAIPAVKTAITIAVKKYVVVAIIAGIAKVIVAKTGVGIGALVAAVLIPVIAYFLYREWQHFPEKLASSISTEVSVELDNKFEEVNTNILTHIFSYVVNAEAKNLGLSVADDPDIEAKISELIPYIT